MHRSININIPISNKPTQKNNIVSNYLRENHEHICFEYLICYLEFMYMTLHIPSNNANYSQNLK